MENKELIQLAIEAKKNAHTPYSRFNVGAAVETADGKVFQGGNIEIASYSPTICAERVAIFQAVFQGHKQIKKVAVVGDSQFTFPCGVCRQVIREFGKDATIIVANENGEYKEYGLEELLPHSFGPEDMEGEIDV